VVFGLGVQRVFPALLARYFNLDPGLRWDPVSAVQGVAIGMLTTLLFTLPPLLEVRRIRPSRILRREMTEERPGLRERLSSSKAAFAASGLLLVGIGGVAWWLSDSPRTGAYFIGGCAASLAILSGFAWLLLRALRAVSRPGMPASLRHGIANVYRPGNQASALLVALGLGVMFTLTVYLLQRSMLQQIAASAPPGMPNVFLINITPKERDGVLATLKKWAPGAELVPLVYARLSTIDGAPVTGLGLRGWSRRFTQSRPLTWSAAPPAQTEFLEGSWWKADSSAGRDGTLVAVNEDAARILKLRAGSRLEFAVGAKRILATVTAVYRSEAVRIGANMEFVLNPGSLEGLPTIYFGALRMKPADVAGLQRESYQKYPTVTVINGADVLAIVQEVVDQIALVVRFVSGFAILGGMIILASSVAGTRFRRIREVVILKTLGATRRRVAAIFSVEYVVVGAIAGLLGSLLATAFSYLVLDRLFKIQYRFDPLPHVVAIVLTAGIANVAGWLASFRILGQKPLEALREE
jgi:putative ABC transport system permease protein